jgi:sugar lactone lactonase YvrE
MGASNYLRNLRLLLLVKNTNMMIRYLVYIFLVIGSFRSFSQGDLRTLYNESLAAYEAKDYTLFLEKTKAANTIRPNHPTLVYNLAGAFSLNDSLGQSLKVLQQLFLIDGTVDIEQDEDFASVIKTDEYLALRQWLKLHNEPGQQSDIALTFKLPSLHPEGFDIDPKSGAYYIGGVHDRKVVSISASGEVTDFVTYTQHSEMYAVMGVVYDTKRELIWICTAATNEMVEFDSEKHQGKSSVLVFDKDGKLIKKEVISEGNFFGDLILKNDGSVLISDTGLNKIYHCSLNTGIAEWADLSGTVLNLQGIAFDKKERKLFLADYLTGLYAYTTGTKTLEKIDLPDTVSEKGFDGIYFYRGSILGIQNGSQPNRSYRFYLNKSQNSISKITVIDQALDLFDEPTQGTIIASQFYYLANSPWQHYKDGNLLVDEVPETIILRYVLK